jgi:hypothetical protein
MVILEDPADLTVRGVDLGEEQAAETSSLTPMVLSYLKPVW